MKQKQKILFVLIHMDIGGIEKAFLNLMTELVKTDQYEIDVFLFCHRGGLLEHLPKECSLLKENKTVRLIGISQKEAWKESKWAGFKRLCAGGMAKYLSSGIAYSFLMKGIRLEKKYDRAVSFMHSKTRSLYGGTNEFVLHKVQADIKITFIHGDFQRASLNTSYNRKIYGKFDRIASVSMSCKRMLDQEWPELSEKSYVVGNCVNVEQIRELSKVNEKVYDKDFFNFVTVARIDAVKGLDRMLTVCARLKKEGYSFRWYVVGGGETEKLEIQITSLELSNEVFLLGKQENPYCYMKNADVFLLPSYQEAAPVVFQEANCLGVPIITTDTLSAREMVEQPGIGLVCENSEAGLHKALKSVMDHRDRLEERRKSMSKKTDNARELEQFKAIMKKTGERSL